MLASAGVIVPFSIFKCKVYFLLHKEGGRSTGFGCIINHNFFLEQACYWFINFSRKCYIYYAR